VKREVAIPEAPSSAARAVKMLGNPFLAFLYFSPPPGPRLFPTLPDRIARSFLGRQFLPWTAFYISTF